MNPFMNLKILLKNIIYNMEHLKLFEDFVDKVTYEMTGSPKIYGWPLKADFEEFMQKHGFTHTTLTKNTDLLVTDDAESDTGKMGKAKRYGIPIVTYAQLAKDKTLLYKKLTRKNKMSGIMKRLGEM